MAREQREVWAKRVARWRKSGLTAKECAAEVGVNAGTLAHWGWRLGREGTATQGVDRTRARPAAEWVEVVHSSSLSAAPPTGPEAAEKGTATASGGFELVLPGGRVLRVPSCFDDAALRRLLSALEGR